MVIDTTIDVRTDAQGKDPDQSSPTLRRYHQLLWSKPLPHRSTLRAGHDTRPNLHHRASSACWPSAEFRSAPGRRQRNDDAAARPEVPPRSLALAARLRVGLRV